MNPRLPLVALPLAIGLLAPLSAAALGAQASTPRSAPHLAGCYRITSGRGALGPRSGGGFGTLPPGFIFTDSLLFEREGDPTYVMRALAGPDSARRWSPPRVVGTWHPHPDSVFAAFSNESGRAGVALRFRIIGDSLDGMARPFTRRTRWELDVPVAARRAECPSRRRANEPMKPTSGLGSAPATRAHYHVRSRLIGGR